MTFFDAFAENDLKMNGLSRNLVKPMKNSTIVEKLNLKLTEDELSQLDTLINPAEKYNWKVKKRREAGMKTRKEYMAAEQAKTEDKLLQLEQEIKRCPSATHQQLAEHLGGQFNG